MALWAARLLRRDPVHRLRRQCRQPVTVVPLARQRPAGALSRYWLPGAPGDATPKQPAGSGTPMRLAEDHVITGRAVPIALEPLGGPRWSWWQLPIRALCTQCVEGQSHGYRDGDKQGEHSDDKCEIGTGERSARHKADD